MLTPEQMREALRETEALSQHLARVHVLLARETITECRGPVTVVLDGLGAVQDVSIPGMEDTADCVLAALRAAEGRVQAGYDAFGSRI